MTKYKLYTFSGAMYVVPLYKCEYVDTTVTLQWHYSDNTVGR